MTETSIQSDHYSDYFHALQPIFNIELGKNVAYEIQFKEGVGDGHGKNTSEIDQEYRKRALSVAVNMKLEGSINMQFSPQAIVFENGRYVFELLDHAKTIGFNLKKLVIEINEGDLIYDAALLMVLLNDFRRHGVKVAIDDFGAGYAGLNLLANIIPDFVRVHGMLLTDVDTNGAKLSIVRAISQVCLDLGIEIIAKGVKTQGEFKSLRKLGIVLYHIQ
ncbi:MAG: EAL domain-containing protein [Zetaproteobacteria bacterium]|nr:EAL domain-containing protein [Zetaproteobacteria bacterium]